MSPPVHIQHYSENPVVQKKFPITPQIHLLLKCGGDAVAVLLPLGFPKHSSSISCLSVPACLTGTACQSRECHGVSWAWSWLCISVGLVLGGTPARVASISSVLVEVLLSPRLSRNRVGWVGCSLQTFLPKLSLSLGAQWSLHVSHYKYSFSLPSVTGRVGESSSQE